MQDETFVLTCSLPDSIKGIVTDLVLSFRKDNKVDPPVIVMFQEDGEDPVEVFCEGSTKVKSFFDSAEVNLPLPKATYPDVPWFYFGYNMIRTGILQVPSLERTRHLWT